MFAPQPRRRQHGVTMAELAIVVAVLAGIAAWAAPNMRTIITNFSVRSNAETLLNGLHLARSEAIKRNVDIQLVATLSPLSWNVGCVTVVGNCPALLHSYVASASTSVTVTATGGTTAVFNSLGRLGSGTTQFDISDPAASKNMRILIKANGQAKMCDPAIALASDPQFCV